MREPRGDDDVQQGEYHYNGQHQETHGNSLPDPAIIVFTNVPDRALATALARALLDQRLAACVNIGAPVESIYHWRGQIETGQEVPVLVKTRSALYTNVEDAIRKIHPYDTPEIIAIPIAAGSARYLEWLGDETGAR
jgi:periplasmic divalent cation tolerance protein